MNAVERSNGTNIQGWSSETGYHWQSTEGYEIYHIGYGVGDWFERKFEVKDPDHKVIGYMDRVGDAIECANLDLYMTKKARQGYLETVEKFDL